VQTARQAVLFPASPDADNLFCHRHKPSRTCSQTIPDRCYCAELRIYIFRTARLSADDRQITMQKSAFWVFSGCFSAFPALA
jgi:hypothetical protein